MTIKFIVNFHYMHTFQNCISIIICVCRNKGKGREETYNEGEYNGQEREDEHINERRNKRGGSKQARMCKWNYPKLGPLFQIHPPQLLHTAFIYTISTMLSPRSLHLRHSLHTHMPAHKTHT